MTSGKPLHIKELKYIWETRDQWASLVARDLSMNYSHLNGGKRIKEVVLLYQKDMSRFSTFREWWEQHTKQEPAQTTPIPDLRKGKLGKKKPPAPTVSE